MNLIKWFKDLFNQKVEGYICTREDTNPHSINAKILRKFEVKNVKFNIPFLDPINHWTQLYFIPKTQQEDLIFLQRLVRVLPITCIFRKRILQGFLKEDFDLIEVWSRNSFYEIKKEVYHESMIVEEEQMKIETEKAAALAIKVENQRKAKLEAKMAAKQEKLAQKEAEKEARKAARKK